MSTVCLALIVSVSGLAILPELLHPSTFFDKNPRAGLVVWVTIGTMGWLSAITFFLAVGLGTSGGSLLSTLVEFIRHFGDGHPLRGLGVSEVVGLSVAFDITALLVGGVIVATFKIWKLRHQQRTVLDLVASNETVEGNVTVLDHVQPLAYFLPGDGGRVVLSTGALEVLTANEVGAVIFHEHGHRHGRHGALLVPLQALSPFVSFLPLARHAPSVIRTYLEMAADDFARQRGDSVALRSALEKSPLFHQPPLGALGMHDVVERRIQRLTSRAVPVLELATLVLCLGGGASLLWTMFLIR
jgi:Zn-dependent protease with chaperone function